MPPSTLAPAAIPSGVFSDAAPANVAVSVRGLAKSYSIAQNAVKHTTAGEALMHRLRHPFEKTTHDTFWALNDVSFDIQQGDVVGIIGRNGAGKSTLLKILSRITEPTRGRIDLYGRVGSLLEVGTGFHAELTGRENIFLNGAILGMTRAEIARQFDAIVDFSGTEQFLDTPVKRYSSGMYVRLAFAVAAHLNPEILIVDEVLAVGDAEFQKKCLGKMQDVAQSGRTVLFVSHSMQSVSALCSKGIYLENGGVTYHGDTGGAVDRYLNAYKGERNNHNLNNRRGSGKYRYVLFQPLKETFDSTEEKVFNFKIERQGADVGKMSLSAHIVNNKGITIAQCDSQLVGLWVNDAEYVEGTFRFSSPWLKPGEYTIDLSICAQDLVDVHEGATSFFISPILPYTYTAPEVATMYGEVFSDFRWTIA